MREKKAVMAHEKAYLAQLNVFGYELTAIGRTEEEARNAIKEGEGNESA